MHLQVEQPWEALSFFSTNYQRMNHQDNNKKDCFKGARFCNSADLQSIYQGVSHKFPIGPN